LLRNFQAIEAPHRDFWGAAWFQGHLYLSTLNLIFRLERSGEFKPINSGSAYHLAAPEKKLLSIGATELMHFDGRE